VNYYSRKYHLEIETRHVFLINKIIMSFIGKVFLLAALAGYSYLLLTDVTLGKQFDTKYANF